MYNNLSNWWLKKRPRYWWINDGNWFSSASFSRQWGLPVNVSARLATFLYRHTYRWQAMIRPAGKSRLIMNKRHLKIMLLSIVLVKGQPCVTSFQEVRVRQWAATISLFVNSRKTNFTHGTGSILDMAGCLQSKRWYHRNNSSSFQ